MHAEASADWLFMGWSGDKSTDHTQDSITVSMVRPVSVTATFSDDADGDGLLNTREFVFKTNPRKKDSDGDGADDPDELIAGTSPTNSISVLAVELDFEGSANGISFFGVSGRFYQVEYIDDLAGEWTPLGAISEGKDAIITEHDSSAGKRRFYRIRVSDDTGKL